MLKNFNNLMKSILWQDLLNVEPGAQPQDPGWLRSICDTNLFFLRYLKDAAMKFNIVPTKQFENRFILMGSLTNMVKFLKAFKVDKDFMENPADFLFYAPTFMFGDQNHYLNADEQFPEIDFMRYGVDNTHDMENALRQTFDGTWIELYQGDGPKRVRIGKATPKDLAAELTKAVKMVNPEYEDSQMLWLKVEVNCQGLKNAIWDEIANYVDTPEGLEKKLHEKDDYEFDYTQLNVKDKTPFEGADEAQKVKPIQQKPKK